MESDIFFDMYEFFERGHKEDAFSLIIYDIVDNKRRLKLSSFLEGYGVRVQKSAFEIRVDKKKFDQMIAAIPQFVSEKDSVKLYKVHGNGEVFCWGNAKPEISDEVIIV